MNLLKLLADKTGITRELAEAGLTQAEPPSVSRRKLLFGGGSVLAALWAEAAYAGGPPPGTLHWLVRRLTMGLTVEELNLATTLGYDDYLEYHLNPAAINDAALDAQLVPLTTLTMQPYQLVQLPQGQVVNQLIEATIRRSVFSKRQLFERMVEFWTDHFNIDITNDLDSYLKTVDDRDVIRANALGTFPALLSASAHSPAMLVYLDNATSIAGNPNENYARELMELHTMGVDGGYTQQDVVEVARCFTGWGLYRGTDPTLLYTFQFRNDRHDNGQKVVLGQIIPAGGGINDGLMVLDILANHPSTAQFISRKLCTRFWGEEPPQTLVDNVAATYTATGGDIKEMLRTLFHDPEVANSPLKYKRPYHLIVSAMRVTQPTMTNANGVRTQLTAAGQLPFYWSPPDGYPDSLDKWVGLILPRWNFGASLMNTNVNGLNVNIDTFLLGVANNADAIAAHIDAAMFGGTMDPAERTRIRDYLLPNPPTTLRKRDAVGLAIASPGFQWY